MESECFDLALEGTSLNDLFECDPSCKTVVLESSAHYGTTYSSIEELQKSPYICDFKILKNINKEKLMIEAIPTVLSESDAIIKSFGTNVFGNHIDFVNINDIYFIDEKRTRIPTSKNDILKMSLSNSDSFYLYKTIKEKDINILKYNFHDKTHPIYKCLVDCNIFNKRDFRRYCDNFGGNIFLYPLHGLSEISESACMRNSFKGTTYVLNANLIYTYESGNDYKHKFSCDMGNILAKEYKPRILKENRQYVRYILTGKMKFSTNFIAYFKRPNIMKQGTNGSNNDDYTTEGLTKIIGISPEAEVSSSGQVLYFIRNDCQIEDIDLQILMIDKKDIIVDIKFITKYAPD